MFIFFHLVSLDIGCHLDAPYSSPNLHPLFLTLTIGSRAFPMASTFCSPRALWVSSAMPCRDKTRTTILTSEFCVSCTIYQLHRAFNKSPSFSILIDFFGSSTCCLRASLPLFGTDRNRGSRSSASRPWRFLNRQSAGAKRLREMTSSGAFGANNVKSTIEFPRLWQPRNSNQHHLRFSATFFFFFGEVTIRSGSIRSQLPVSCLRFWHLQGSHGNVPIYIQLCGVALFRVTGRKRRKLNCR